MGHLRLGSMPNTAPWRRVVELLAEGADVGPVAAATTRAALDGLERARGDEGFAHTVWLLAQTVLAARQPDFVSALAQAGVRTGAEPGVLDVAAGLSDAVERHLRERHRGTDLGEMAQLAGVESITALLSRHSGNLFETTPSEVRAAARDLSTRSGFSELAHDFFARFSRRFLTYHLSRELSNHVGGNGCFADPRSPRQQTTGRSLAGRIYRRSWL